MSEPQTSESPQPLDERLQSKQFVCGPDAPRYSSEWVDRQEKYLFGRGWERDYTTVLPTYRDPKGSKIQNEVKVVGMLPVRGDDLRKEEPLRQVHVYPMSYNFTLEDALDMQRRRDAAGDAGPSPLDRLHACEEKCGELARELERLKVRVRGVLATPQITFEGMRLALKELIGA